MENLNIQKISYKLFKRFVHSENKRSASNYNHSLLSLPINIFIQDIDQFNIEEIQDIINVLDQEEILKSEAAQSLYSGWGSIVNSSENQLRINQLLHYYSVYSELGKVFLPRDFISINLKGSDKNLYVKIDKEAKESAPEDYFEVGSFTLEEFNKALIKYFIEAKAIKKSEQELIENYIIKEFSESDLEDIFAQTKSKDIQFIIAKELNIIPRDPGEFIKFATRIVTEEKVFINNKNTQFLISLSKTNFQESIFDFIGLYPNGINKLASVFNRYKDIFIAAKGQIVYNKETSINLIDPNYVENTHKRYIKVINKISKLSKKEHRPFVQLDYLTLTSIKRSEEEFMNIIKPLNISYLVKIYKALNFRLISIKNENKSAIYRIRNGKTFFKSEAAQNLSKKSLKLYLSLVKSQIEEKLNKNIQKKKVTLLNVREAAIDYAVPLSGKQFVNDIPFGSQIKITKKKNIVIGVSWKNVDNSIIDIDLSSVSSFNKIGWNGDHTKSNILFSGDIVDPGEGSAAENIIINKVEEKELLSLKVNLYDSGSIDPERVSFKFYIAIDKYKESHKKSFKDYFKNKDYILSKKSKILFSTEMCFEKERKELSLGVFNKDTFVFYESTGNGYVSRELTYEESEVMRIEAMSQLLFKDLNLISYEYDKEDQDCILINFDKISKTELTKLVEENE